MRRRAHPPNVVTWLAWRGRMAWRWRTASAQPGRNRRRKPSLFGDSSRGGRGVKASVKQ